MGNRIKKWLKSMKRRISGRRRPTVTDTREPDDPPEMEDIDELRQEAMQSPSVDSPIRQFEDGEDHTWQIQLHVSGGKDGISKGHAYLTLVDPTGKIETSIGMEPRKADDFIKKNYLKRNDFTGTPGVIVDQSSWVGKSADKEEDYDVTQSWNISERQAMAALAKINRDRRLNQEHLPDLSKVSSDGLGRLANIESRNMDQWKNPRDRYEFLYAMGRIPEEDYKRVEKMGIDWDDVEDPGYHAAAQLLLKHRMNREDTSHEDFEQILTAGPEYTALDMNCAGWALSVLDEISDPDVIENYPGIPDQEDNLNIHTGRFRAGGFPIPHLMRQHLPETGKTWDMIYRDRETPEDQRRKKFEDMLLWKDEDWFEWSTNEVDMVTGMVVRGLFNERSKQDWFAEDPTRPFTPDELRNLDVEQRKELYAKRMLIGDRVAQINPQRPGLTDQTPQM